MESGVPSVITTGTVVMLVWSVGSWDTLCWVSMAKDCSENMGYIHMDLVAFYRSYSIYQCPFWKRNWCNTD